MAENIDLAEEKGKLRQLLPLELQKYLTETNEVTSIEYPVSEYPQKVKSLSFDKTRDILGVLKGIKGQYLIFADNTVLNIRKHNGYFLEIESPS